MKIELYDGELDELRAKFLKLLEDEEWSREGGLRDVNQRPIVEQLIGLIQAYGDRPRCVVCGKTEVCDRPREWCALVPIDREESMAGERSGLYDKPTAQLTLEEAQEEVKMWEERLKIPSDHAQIQAARERGRIAALKRIRELTGQAEPTDAAAST